METPPIEPSPPSPISTADRQWAIALHLTALLSFGPHGGNIIGPLIIWLIKKPESAYLDEVGKRVLNFQVSYALYIYIAFFVSTVLSWTVIIWFFFWIFACLFSLAWLFFTILGAIKESNGETYTPPFVIKFFS